MTKQFKETLATFYNGNNSKQLPSCSEQLDDLIKDAERYRFIRDSAWQIKLLSKETGKERNYTLNFFFPPGGHDNDFDKLIDESNISVSDMLKLSALNKLSASEREVLGLI